MEEHLDGTPKDLADDDVGTEVRHTRRALPRVSTKSTVYKWTVPLSALIPMVALVAWVSEASQRDQVFTTLAGSEIGGHLAQTQAKAIDFVCSALLAPLLFAGLNLLWFACARVCVVNESAHSVPLQTLATASALSRGTYDPVEYYTLLRGRTWRLVVLGGIVLSSALGASAMGVSTLPPDIPLRLIWMCNLTVRLQNVTAYEAFNEEGPSKEDFSLRLLRDAVIDSSAAAASYGFDEPEMITAAQGVSSVLQELEFKSAALNQGDGHVLVNSTSASMANLDNSVITLVNVPGTRLSAECVPTNVTSVYVDSGTSFADSVKLRATTTYSSIMYTAGGSQELGYCSPAYSYIGGQEEGSTPILSNYAFPAWGVPWDFEPVLEGDPGFYLIYTLSGIHSQVLPSIYGDLQPTHLYKSDDESQQFELAPATYWGLQCMLLQQQGLINYTRSADLRWSATATAFDKEKTSISSQLINWQRMVAGDDWTSPQLGAVLFGRSPLKSCLTGPEECAPKRNISDTVGNYIYASAEISRILYNVAAANTSRAEGRPEYYHNVTGSVNEQYYRITYVPALLLVALVSVILAALMTTALMISVWNTVSWSRFRQVDVMRLVVDAVGGSLRHQDEHQFAKLGGASDDEILSWAQEYRVAYVKVPTDQSQESGDFDRVQPLSVQLIHKANPRVRDWIKGMGTELLQQHQPR